VKPASPEGFSGKIGGRGARLPRVPQEGQSDFLDGIVLSGGRAARGEEMKEKEKMASRRSMGSGKKSCILVGRDR